jgi:hypothetical protein
MSNPVLVEVTRGNLVESRHRGLVIAVDSEGRTVFSLGDTESGVFPRSACKAMQALPLMESGAADAYGFGNKELRSPAPRIRASRSMSRLPRRCWLLPAATCRRSNAAPTGRLTRRR